MIPVRNRGIFIWTRLTSWRRDGHADDGKTRALAASRTLNPHPEKVTDPAFGPGGFFDPADLVQVKYEMVRTAEAGQLPAGQAAAAFGFSRQSLYQPKRRCTRKGLPA